MSATLADKRATGWKIPLLFCGVVVAVVVVTSLLRQEKVDMTPIPAPLLEQAKAIHMNLEGDEDGKGWKELISKTAGAFATRADKDVRLTIVIKDAAKLHRFDAACTASVLMYNDHQRDAVLLEVGQTALQDCANLPWAVMASGGMKDPKTLAALHSEITTRWESCSRSK